jgi:hypothetical protein
MEGVSEVAICRHFASSQRQSTAARNFEGTRCHGRQLRVVLVELNEQLADVAVDVVADLADAFERQVLRVIEDPADSAVRLE